MARVCPSWLCPASFAHLVWAERRATVEVIALSGRSVRRCRTEAPTLVFVVAAASPAQLASRLSLPPTARIEFRFQRQPALRRECLFAPTPAPGRCQVPDIAIIRRQPVIQVDPGQSARQFDVISIERVQCEQRPLRNSAEIQCIGGSDIVSLDRIRRRHAAGAALLVFAPACAGGDRRRLLRRSQAAGAERRAEPQG
jgi:hypothetical protein